MERVIYLWVVWVMFVMRKGASVLQPSDPWIPLQCSLSCLAMGPVWHRPGYSASAGSLDDVQVLPCLWSWGSCILYLPYLRLGSLLVHKTYWSLQSSENFGCLLCIPSDCEHPSGSLESKQVLFFFFLNHLSTMSLHWQAECQAPLRQLILFPGYSLESQAQLTFFVILPSLLGGPIISHSLQLRLREIGCWKQWPTPVLIYLNPSLLYDLILQILWAQSSKLGLFWQFKI